MSIRAARHAFPFVRVKKGVFFFSLSWCLPRILWPEPGVCSSLKGPCSQPRGGRSRTQCCPLWSSDFQQGRARPAGSEDPFEPVSGELGTWAPRAASLGWGGPGQACRPFPCSLPHLPEPVGSRGTINSAAGRRGAAFEEALLLSRARKRRFL